MTAPSAASPRLFAMMAPPTSRFRRVLLALAVVALLPGCDGFLDREPPDRLTSDIVIDSPAGARQALAGAYNALQSGSYYGGTLLFFGDLSADNTTHTGTFGTFAEADANALRAGNGATEGLYAALYYAISIPNHLLEKVPAVEDLDAEERDQILGEAHFLRALHHHNLVRLWGDVPLITTTIVSVEQAAQVRRSPVAEVMAQIGADLDAAEDLMTSTSQTTRASLGAVRALRARVRLGQGDWAGAEAAATAVEAMGYRLAPVYADLFSTTATTDEDIFRVAFDAQAFNNLSFYYRVRREVRPTPDLATAYATDDARRTWNILTDSQGRLTGNKFRDSGGGEDVHVIRFAEVLLTRAEARARLGRLDDALADLNRVRTRAALAPLVLGTDVTTQDDVLAAVWAERRLELAFEGDRWTDLTRTDRATTVMGIPAFATLYPIPQRELDVAPNMTQNPGY